MTDLGNQWPRIKSKMDRPAPEDEVRVDTLVSCPFCGEEPDLPSGDGSQYEIECNCGMAISSVQICDLMTIDERMEDDFMDNYRHGGEYIERAKVEAIKKWNKRAN